ncbi:MAG: 2-hydroxyacid dehydrogenase [Desulfobacterales bacterium]
MKVLISGKVPAAVLQRIRTRHEVDMHEDDHPIDRSELLLRVRDVAGLMPMITEKVDRELMEAARHLRIVANHGVGYDNIDVEAATDRGIWVTNTPGVLTDATADLAFALLLAAGRRIVEGDRRTREGRFEFWAPQHFLGREISGKVLGIIGAGRIGKALAQRAKGFRMTVLYHNRRRLDAGEEKRLGLGYATLPELLATCDYLSIHAPLTPETRHLIGPRELAMMKPTACLINTARGPVVDETALVEALRRRTIFAAALDVYEDEPRLSPGLAGLDNVILTPHIGSATVETRERMASLAADNLLAGLEGSMPPNCLNPQARKA